MYLRKFASGKFVSLISTSAKANAAQQISVSSKKAKQTRFVWLTVKPPFDRELSGLYQTMQPCTRRTERVTICHGREKCEQNHAPKDPKPDPGHFETAAAARRRVLGWHRGTGLCVSGPPDRERGAYAAVLEDCVFAGSLQPCVYRNAAGQCPGYRPDRGCPGLLVSVSGKRKCRLCRLRGLRGETGCTAAQAPCVF